MSKIYYPIVIVLVFLSACTGRKEQPDYSRIEIAKELPAQDSGNSQFELRTYLSSDSKIPSWGYDIYLDNKLYLHQPQVPARAGNLGFKNNEDAKKVGIFVIHKLKMNLMPPTISKKELDSLSIE